MYCLQEPVEIRLGRNVKTVVRRSRRRHQISWDYGYYVPLLSSLNQLLSDDLVLSEASFASMCVSHFMLL